LKPSVAVGSATREKDCAIDLLDTDGQPIAERSEQTPPFSGTYTR